MKRKVFTWLNNPVTQFWIAFVLALIYCDLAARY